jgi:hypothetical protein
LSIYTQTNSTGAILEHGLSKNLDQVKSTTQHRQAGHYKSGTNILAGMNLARNERIQHARPRSSRLMVLMTDGETNEPGSSATAKAAVITEANLAQANKITILTISLGAGADIAAVQSQLDTVFREIANSRTLKLISDHWPQHLLLSLFGDCQYKLPRAERSRGHRVLDGNFSDVS